jgi:predicted O-methyltransferase YrrM
VPIDLAIRAVEGMPRVTLQEWGYHFEYLNYYSAVNDIPFLAENRDLWHDRPAPPAVVGNLSSQLELMSQLSSYFGELADVPLDPQPGPPAYHWRNDFWGDVDAAAHYALFRREKPQRVIEIGSGWSSLLMAEALARNEEEGAPPATVHQIEPFPRTELLRALPSHWVLHETILQRASLDIFTSLRPGDVCFFDGSHVARAGSDVNWFFFEIVPRLQPGVLIHVHDIFWPSDYPDEWILDRVQTWNEQYLVQAFLMFNQEFEVLLCNSALADRYKAELASLLEGTKGKPNGVSLWLRRRSDV